MWYRWYYQPMLVKVTYSDEELAAIDRLRGQIPRATWIRNWTLWTAQAVASGKLTAEETRMALPTTMIGA